MITVVEHLSHIIGTVRRLPPIGLNLLDAQGCVLAEDVTSEVALPGFANSAMDGYAVHAADLGTASERAPVTLPVVHDIAAGNTSGAEPRAGPEHEDHDRRSRAPRCGCCRSRRVH
ncbi:MAG TPA: hypothetical protein VIM49_10535 [Dermatophilaceae bacterium]